MVFLYVSEFTVSKINQDRGSSSKIKPLLKTSNSESSMNPTKTIVDSDDVIRRMYKWSCKKPEDRWLDTLQNNFFVN